jgi:hypothetical protein
MITANYLYTKTGAMTMKQGGAKSEFPNANDMTATVRAIPPPAGRDSRAATTGPVASTGLPSLLTDAPSRSWRDFFCCCRSKTRTPCDYTPPTNQPDVSYQQQPLIATAEKPAQDKPSCWQWLSSFFCCANKSNPERYSLYQNDDQNSANEKTPLTP